MVKYFTWSGAADKTQILPAPATNKRYRILACPMACNEDTEVVMIYSGGTPPASGDGNIVDFVDKVRLHNEFQLAAPFLTEGKQEVNLFSQSAGGGTTAGRGYIIYLEETY